MATASNRARSVLLTSGGSVTGTAPYLIASPVRGTFSIPTLLKTSEATDSWGIGEPLNSNHEELFMKFARGLHTAVLSLTAASGLSVLAHAEGAPGAVYTMDNSPSSNHVLVFARAGDGTLAAAGSFETGGLGTGGDLGNQGALVLSRNERWLFAVNAGSDEISAFAVRPKGLALVDRLPSGGRRPISLTVHNDLLYVLNAGGGAGDQDNITGFQVDDGHLSQIPGSTRPLSAASTGPAQVQFEAGGRVLVVTEKGTSRIDTYTVD